MVIAFGSLQGSDKLQPFRQCPAIPAGLTHNAEPWLPAEHAGTGRQMHPAPRSTPQHSQPAALQQIPSTRAWVHAAAVSHQADWPFEATDLEGRCKKTYLNIPAGT